MLQQSLALKDACIQYCRTDSMCAYCLMELAWEKVLVMVNLLQPLYEATHIVCGSTYPTINKTLPLYISLIKRIHQACDQYDVTPIEPAAMAMTNKLTKYLRQLFLKTPVICASILDPRFKLQFFANHQTTLACFGTSASKLSDIFQADARKHVTTEINTQTTNTDLANNIIPTSAGMGLFDDMYLLSSSEGCTLEKEIQCFFAKPTEPKDTNIILFWKSRMRLTDQIFSAQIYPAVRYDFIRSPSRRSVVFGYKGVVAAPNPLASAAGLNILAQGGNAADAAVATASVLSVVDPAMGGLGGDAFCMFFRAADRSLTGINGSGRSPKALTLEKLRASGVSGKKIPVTNLNSVTVPGCCATWIDTLERFGSGTLTLSQVLEPAINLAEGGFPVSEVASHEWKKRENFLLKANPNSHELLIGGKKAPQPGDLMVNPSLAQTFKEVATNGKDGFYRGRIAEEIVKMIKTQGGVMELDDLSSHTSELVEPISYSYHTDQEGEITLHELPPNGQGLTALIALGILDCLEEKGVVNMSKLKPNSADWLHTLIECLRLAFADTTFYVADPQKINVPIKDLLKKTYLQNRSELFDPSKAQADVKKGSPLATQETVYFTTSDRNGNACSFIMSIFGSFGTGAVPSGLGFALQNRGCNFVLDENHPNCLQPGKRPYHTIIPAMVTKKDDLYLSLGVMGAFMQPQGHLQVLMNILHGGFSLQAALDSPRFCIAASNVPNQSSKVFLEEGIDTSVVEQLAKMGHDVKVVTGHNRGLFGRGQIIQKLRSKNYDKLVWAAASDPRADGQACVEV
ncbi:hypothetical protein O181_031557 [Austropuccinia psidii MF-1]|uniref:hAT-like transposase RNase-H fold domain-containing protein n=1 Tax=Austropuccinia psidii MF-1 TaxID=1389203 RepID=A0A9Q3CXU7_9BASI|nr:hypothetical protein [Austropuccinia psidii MF-1]